MFPGHWILREEATATLSLEPDAKRWVRLRIIDLVPSLIEKQGADRVLTALALGIRPEEAEHILSVSALQRRGRRGKRLTVEDLPVELPTTLTKTLGNLFVDLCEGRTGFSDPGFRSRLLEALSEERSVLLAEGVRDLQPGLDELGDLFRLGAAERAILRLFACVAADPSLRGVLGNLAVADLPMFIARAEGLPLDEAKVALRRAGRLRSLGLLLEVENRAAPYFQLSSEVLDHVGGFSDEPLLDRLCRKGSGPTFPLETFSLTDAERSVLAGLMATGAPWQILLHGPPGTGKTELVRALAASSGRTTWLVQHGEQGRAEDRRVALQAAVMAADDGLVIVDEADRMLPSENAFFGSPPMEKGWLNDFIDHSPGRILWVANDITGLPASLRRRFTYHLEVRRFTRSQRLDTWKRLATRHPIAGCLPEDAFPELADRYEVNAAGIASALGALQAIQGLDQAPPERVQALLGELISKHATLTGLRPRGPGDRLTRHFELEAIHADQCPGDLRDALQAAVEPAGRRDPQAGLNILFWGPPGTGKTELARWLAGQLELPLLLKRASDLLDCFVGNTEKNIRAAFDEASREGALLLLDEADSFFQERAGAQHSWEVSFVNELLTQMENHRGILICCTNLLDRLDRASLRRFPWKIGFRPLTETGAKLVYRRYFDLADQAMEAWHQERLAVLEGLTFGDFHAVQGRLRFRPLETLTHDGILDELERELRYRDEDRKRTLGFGRKP
ncbi:MAG: ATP-binding protein [Pseudomonadota bacterium]